MSYIPPQELALGNGFYLSESLPASHQLCQNWYPNYPENDSISKAHLLPTPGLTEIENTGPSSSNRGSHVLSGVPFFVNGNTLWRLDRSIDAINNENFTLTNIGNIPGQGRVSIADSGTELCIVVPGTNQAYIYSDANGLQQITDPSFIPQPQASIVNGVVFASGYFVFHADNAVVFHSNVNDGMSYNALDFFTYQNGKNDVVGLHEFKEQLYVFSVDSSAVYAPTNTTLAGSAFVKIDGYEFSKGLSSQFCVYDFDGSFVILGQGVNESPKIYVFTGNNFTPISTTSIENIIHQYSIEDIQESFGFNYTSRGAVFAVFNFRENTFVFDSKATGLSGKKIWHERRSENLSDKSRWRVNSLITAYNRLLCGDSESGIIGFIDDAAYTDYGNTRVWDVSLATIENNSKTMFFHYFEIEVEGGIATSYDDEPVIALRYSDDGKTFPHAPRSLTLGDRGEFRRKVRWYNLGSTSKQRVWRLTGSNNQRYVLLKALVGMDG